MLLTELFRHQSKNWPKIAEEHLERVYETILEFVENATAHLEMEEHVLAEIQDIMKAKLEENREEAEKEMDKLKQDEQRQPITYNHYYTDNVQKSRLNMFQKLINQAKDKLKGDGDTRNSMSLDFVANSLRKNLIVNMDEQACSEALAGLDAYYKVCYSIFRL